MHGKHEARGLAHVVVDAPPLPDRGDDMREAVAALRESRMSAAEASASKPRSRTTKAAPRAADDMLKDLL